MQNGFLRENPQFPLASELTRRRCLRGPHFPATHKCAWDWSQEPTNKQKIYFSSIQRLSEIASHSKPTILMRVIKHPQGVPTSTGVPLVLEIKVERGARRKDPSTTPLSLPPPASIRMLRGLPETVIREALRAPRTSRGFLDATRT